MQEVAPYWTCVKLYLWGLNYSRHQFKSGENHPPLSHTYVVLHAEAYCTGLSACAGVAGGWSIWALVGNSRLNPRVHESETKGGSHIDLPSFSQRRWVEGGGEQDGDISTVLQCIIRKAWYRISSKLTWSLYSAARLVKTHPGWRWCASKVLYTLRDIPPIPTYSMYYTLQYKIQSLRGNRAFSFSHCRCLLILHGRIPIPMIAKGYFRCFNVNAIKCGCISHRSAELV